MTKRYESYETLIAVHQSSLNVRSLKKNYSFFVLTNLNFVRNHNGT